MDWITFFTFLKIIYHAIKAYLFIGNVSLYLINIASIHG